MLNIDDDITVSCDVLQRTFAVRSTSLRPDPDSLLPENHSPLLHAAPPAHTSP